MARNSSYREFSDLEALKIQLRELSVRQANTETQINELDRSVTDTQIDIVPPFVNFLDNSDFLYSDQAYDTTSYTDDDLVLYGWFQRPQADTGTWDNPAGTLPAGDGITQLSYPSAGNYPSANCYWDTSGGYLSVKGGTKIASRLSQKRGYAGNYMAVRMQITARTRPAVSFASADVTNDVPDLKVASTDHPYPTGTLGRFTNSGGGLPSGLSAGTDYWLIRSSSGFFKVATSLSNALAGTAIAYTDSGTGTHTFTPTFVAPAADMKLKVSLWDNDGGASWVPDIIEGDVIGLTSVLGGSSGSVRRDYILEIHMPDGSRHYSDTSTFTAGENRRDDTVSCTTPSTSNFVTVSWPTVVGASRYRLYRRTPSEATTDWFLVGTTTNTTLRDTGGYFGNTWTPPYPTSVYKYKQKAETYFDDIGDIMQTEDEVQEVTLAFNMPTLITDTMGTQYLQIEFVNSDYSDTDVSSFSLITIDRVGLSYTSGRWCPSASDLTVQGTEIVVNPPPSGGGDGGNPTGGGYDNCVEENTPVLLWSPPFHDEWVPAKDVVVGDLLLSYDPSLDDLAPTKVKRLIKGMSTGNYILHLEDGGTVVCTMSHSLISGSNWGKGVNVRSLEVGDSLRSLTDDFVVGEVGIVGIEKLSTVLAVRSFNLDRKRRNFVTKGGKVGYFNHNNKDSGNGDIVV